MLPAFSYIRPNSVGQVLEELKQPGACVHAGGTDLLGCLRDGAMKAARVVSLSSVPELRGVSTLSDSSLRIGALTTLAEVAADAAVRERYPCLAQAALAAASPQLRNQATIGGNLCQRPRCWYFRDSAFPCLRKGGDTCYAAAGENEFHAIFGASGCCFVHPSDVAPAMIALDARLRIAGPDGSRIAPAEAFFVSPDEDVTRENVLRPGELLTDILLPAPIYNRSCYRKVRERGAWDFALTGVAVALQMTEGRIARARVVLSGVAPKPWRVPEVEKSLAGKRLDARAAAAAAAISIQGASPLSQNAYKVDLVRGVVEEALLASV
jgi:xanthine dehydrogenase YagS FAD-binding subunit